MVLGMVVHTQNSRTYEMEARWSEVHSHPELHEILLSRASKTQKNYVKKK